MQTWVGIDNGVSGSIGWVSSDGEFGQEPTPTIKCLNYTKRAQNTQRVDQRKLIDILGSFPIRGLRVFLERPMVNPKRFQATASALRALESTLIALESLCASYTYVDSKAWQKKLLPDVKGSANLKKASLQIGSQLFPPLQETFEIQGDADGILIAHWAKVTNQ